MSLSAQVSEGARVSEISSAQVSACPELVIQ